MRPGFLRPRILTLIATYRCTAACDHCCFGCSPQTTGRIARARMHDLIDEALEIPSIRYVSFVGGECFLLGAELDEHFAHCKANGLAALTTTNGYWAVTPASASARMRRAAAAGLTTISISTGQMHAEFVPPARVVNAALAACEAGLETSITIEAFDRTTFDADAIVNHPDIARLSASGALAVSFRDWVPDAKGLGRATLAHDPARSRFGANAQHAGCSIVLDDLMVTPDLRLLACCGYPSDALDDLILGSVATMTLSQTIEAAPENVLATWLHVAGPERMLMSVKDHLPSYELPLDAVHPCQVCLHLHRDPVALEVLRAKAPAYRTVLEKLYEASSLVRLA